MSNFTCPFCLNIYSSKEVKFVCPECNTAAVPTMAERVRNLQVKCKTAGCGRFATKRVCPKCENEIPKDMLETTILPFSIVGVGNSGKTNYITVMLHELSKITGLRLALSAQNSETRQHQMQNYELIYEKHLPPPGTDRASTLPQIWRVRNLASRHGNTVPTYTFTIFDGAGEAHEELDASSVECRYINTSKAIVLVLDPLILESIKRGDIVDAKIRHDSRHGDDGGAKNAQDVVNNIAEYIKAARGIKASKRLNIPVAVVLTKFDTVINHPAFAQNAVIKNPRLRINGDSIDNDELMQVDAEIRNWLERIDEGAFINALSANFSKYQFFGVSSYGQPPKDAGTLNAIHPHRVLDPVLWLFNMFGFFKKRGLT